MVYLGDTCMQWRPVTDRIMRRSAVSLLLLALTTPPVWALVSTNVPLGHWSYGAVEKLADYGLIDSSMLTIKPLSRVEMARHIAQAMYTLDAMENPPAILLAIVERLKEEFREELILIGILDGSYGGSSIKPVEDPYVAYLYARHRPDLENMRGDVFGQGSNFRAGFASRMKLFDTAAFYVHPEYAYSPRIDDDVDLIEAYGKVMVGWLEVEAGQDSLRWGPGAHGAILISDNVRPLKMVKLSNPQPLQLPWILRYLGPFKGEWFLAELEEDRDVPEAKLSGVRVNIKPLPLVELGASRVVMFGGHGMPHVDLFDYAKLFVAWEEQPADNQLAGFDFSVLLPLPEAVPLRAVKLYGDLAGEDAANGLPSKWGKLWGLQLSDILRTGRTDLRIEYANDHVVGYPNVFYTHSIYSSGYTYEGRIIGHHMGTDSSDLFVQLSHYLTADMVVALAYDREVHSLSADTQPAENIFEGSLLLFPSRDWWIRAGYRYEKGEEGGEDENHIFHVELVRRF